MTAESAPGTTRASIQPLPSKAYRTARIQDGVLLLIVLLVGTMAGAASFTHVHDWTLANSPTGTPDWFGWANSVISELIPTASLIEIGRRRRSGGSIRYPMVLLVAAVGISLTAQLAVAVPTVFGWMVSALPALAFFALSKLVFTATASPRPTHNPVTAPEPATSPATSPDTTQVEVSPAAAHQTRATTTTTNSTTGDQDDTPDTGKEDHRAPAPAKPTPTDTPQVPASAPVAPVSDTSGLLPNARIIAKAHHASHGEPITAGQLAVRLRVPTPIATDLLTSLHPNPINDRPHNGTPVRATQ